MRNFAEVIGWVVIIIQILGVLNVVDVKTTIGPHHSKKPLVVMAARK